MVMLERGHNYPFKALVLQSSFLMDSVNVTETFILKPPDAMLRAFPCSALLAEAESFTYRA